MYEFKSSIGNLARGCGGFIVTASTIIYTYGAKVYDSPEEFLE
jgi:hypothetical protein